MKANLDLTDWLKDRSIIVVLGAGGVGKTTSAIAMAIAGAQRGRRVALLSIDPAKRLAAALGLQVGSEVSLLEFGEANSITGSVDAAMLDQKAVFDEMVGRHSPSDQVTAKILSHPLYKAASTSLSGPLEYMALAKLRDLASDRRYDLIVLDTPPDTHALDFLARPNVLGGFMDAGVLNWLVKPFVAASKLGLGRLFSASERLMGGVAKVTGFKALQAFANFLVLIQDVIGGFHKSGQEVAGLLQQPSTGFVLVAVANHAAARSAIGLTSELRKLDYRVGGMLINKRLPSKVIANLAADHPEFATRSEAEQRAFDALKRRHEGEELATRQLQRALQDDQGSVPIWFLEERLEPLQNMAAMLAFADDLGQS